MCSVDVCADTEENEEGELFPCLQAPRCHCQMEEAWNKTEKEKIISTSSEHSVILK